MRDNIEGDVSRRVKDLHCFVNWLLRFILTAESSSPIEAQWSGSFNFADQWKHSHHFPSVYENYLE